MQSRTTCQDQPRRAGSVVCHLTGAFEMGDAFDTSSFFRDAQCMIRPHFPLLY